MITNKYGERVYSEDDLMSLLMVDNSANISDTTTTAVLPSQLREVIDNMPKFVRAESSNISVEEYDRKNQADWKMPASYKTLDIAKYVLELCATDAELQRVAEELLLYQERNLFDLLRYLKYLVDTMHKNNILCGVGRGSSVASYVLFLLGVHKINSIYYELEITEFLR